MRDLTGQRFGRLVVEHFLGKNRHNTPTWQCQCDCGNKSVATSPNLGKGTTRSCGCLQKELAAEKRRTHGMSRTKLFVKWQGMNRRCYDPKSKSYKNYGDGKTLCLAEWADAIGISVGALHKRLKKGWDVEKALSTPADSKKATRKKMLRRDES